MVSSWHSEFNITTSPLKMLEHSLGDPEHIRIRPFPKQQRSTLPEFPRCSKKKLEYLSTNLFYLLLMEEILDHLGCMNPCKYWNKLPINWCRISSITSIKPDLNWVLGRYFCSFKPQRIHISELGTQAFNAGSGSTCNVGTTDKWLCQCWKTVVPSQNAKRFEWVDIYIYIYLCIHTTKRRNLLDTCYMNSLLKSRSPVQSIVACWF